MRVCLNRTWPGLTTPTGWTTPSQVSTLLRSQFQHQHFDDHEDDNDDGEGEGYDNNDDDIDNEDDDDYDDEIMTRMMMMMMMMMTMLELTPPQSILSLTPCSRYSRPSRQEETAGRLLSASQDGLCQDGGLLQDGPKGEGQDQVPLPQVGGGRLQHRQARDQGTAEAAEGDQSEQRGEERTEEDAERSRRGLQRLQSPSVQHTQVQVGHLLSCEEQL